MGTLLYSTILQTEYKDCQDKTKQDAKRIRTHQAPQPQHRAGRSGWSQEGREVVQARGCQETLGSHQDQQAPGPREQAVLRPRHQDAAHLRKGEDPCLRDGQVPQDPPDKCLNHLKVKVSIEEEYLDDNQKFSLNENDSLTLPLWTLLTTQYKYKYY